MEFTQNLNNSFDTKPTRNFAFVCFCI